MRNIHYKPLSGESYKNTALRVKPGLAIDMRTYLLQSAQGVVNLGNNNRMCYTGDKVHPATQNLELDQKYQLKLQNEAKIDSVMKDITQQKETSANRRKMASTRVVQQPTPSAAVQQA